jgi:leucyl-tRNA---protein transferase
MEIAIINERVPLGRMSQDAFDMILKNGWRILGSSMLRHNVVDYAGEISMTIPLRMRMDGFEFSKSQAKLFKKHSKFFQVKVQQIAIDEYKNQLFLKHCQRFRFGNHYASLLTFIGHEAWHIPVPGYEVEVYDQQKLVACSYFHLGQTTMSGTYCFFDPEYTKHSLGQFTMLLELRIAQQLGKAYYYSGYVHSTPSQFDYKLNFHNIERMDWETNEWLHVERLTVNAVRQPI